MYCREKKTEEIFGKGSKIFGEEYRRVFSKILPKIIETRKNNQDDIIQKDKIIDKLKEELKVKEEKNKELEKSMQTCEENIRKKYEMEISQKQDKVFKITEINIFRC